MNKKSSDSGCALAIFVFFFFGIIIWLFGAAMWLLQFIIPVIGLLIAIAMAYYAWKQVRNRQKAEKLAELNRAELLEIARDTEFRLSVILSSWDDVANTMGVGTIFREAFSTGEATPELVELRSDLTRARAVTERLRVEPEKLSNDELIDAISDADRLWLELTKRYGDSAGS